MRRTVIKTKSKLYNAIILLICSEFIFTSLGFCGHNHNHNEHFNSPPAIEKLQIRQSDSHHTHSSSRHKKEDQSDTREKYHCSCLGNFLSSGILQMYTIKLSFTDLIYKKITAYMNFFENSFFHPPKTT